MDLLGEPIKPSPMQTEIHGSMHKLSKENISAILNNQIQLIEKRISSKGISIGFTDEAFNYLKEKGFDPLFGARPLKRLLQDEVLNPLSEVILDIGENIEDIKKKNKSVVFISGHLSNFELMAMHIEKSGIKLSAIYRPLNNIFLNKIMERIRKKYICKYQIKKGIGGMKKLIHLKKLNYSTALMIDQRVSQGIRSDFFSQKALTTTIPAQLVKKFKIPIVPIFIERINNINFKIVIKNPIIFDNEDKKQIII